MSEHSQASRLTERRQPGGDYNRYQGNPEHGDAIRGQPRLAEQALSACSQGVATAMMAAGWDGAPAGKNAPGFPDDGNWVVKWEGLNPAP